MEKKSGNGKRGKANRRQGDEEQRRGEKGNNVRK